MGEPAREARAQEKEHRLQQSWESFPNRRVVGTEERPFAPLRPLFESYREAFVDASARGRVYDYTPKYTIVWQMPYIFGAPTNLSSSSKVVIFLRDPIERYWSSHGDESLHTPLYVYRNLQRALMELFDVSRARLTERPLLPTLSDVRAVLRGGVQAEARPPFVRHPFAVKDLLRGYYAPQLRHWFENYAPYSDERYFIATHAQAQRDLAGVISDALHFLCLPQHERAVDSAIGKLNRAGAYNFTMVKAREHLRDATPTRHRAPNAVAEHIDRATHCLLYYVFDHFNRQLLKMRRGLPAAVRREIELEWGRGPLRAKYQCLPHVDDEHLWELIEEYAAVDVDVLVRLGESERIARAAT